MRTISLGQHIHSLLHCMVQNYPRLTKRLMSIDKKREERGERAGERARGEGRGVRGCILLNGQL